MYVQKNKNFDTTSQKSISDASSKRSNISPDFKKPQTSTKKNTLNSLFKDLKAEGGSYDNLLRLMSDSEDDENLRKMVTRKVSMNE